MNDQERQKKLLALLLVILVGALGYRALEMGSEGAGAAPASRGSGREAVTLADTEIPHLNLEDLRLEAAAYRAGRNPFRFGEAPRPKAPPPPAPKPRSRPTPPRPKPTVAAAPARPAAPRPPAVTFSYLGSFGREGRRIAVFEKDDEIYNALAGDVLLEKFIVDKIGFESADIKFVGFPDAPQTRLEAGG